MYVAIVLLESIDITGKLSTLIIKHKDNISNVIIDRIQDIVPDTISRENEIQNTIIYNIDECNINSITSKPRSFSSIDNEEIKFKIGHSHIPLLPNLDYTFGFYTFILPKGFKFTKLSVTKTSNNFEEINEVSYKLKLDQKTEVQILEIPLRSRRSFFSLNIDAEAKYSPGIENISGEFIDFKVVDELLTSNIGNDSFGRLTKRLLDETNSVIDLRPNLFGIGINFNALIDKIRGRR